MISYTLNSPHYDYQGGGISPTSFQTVTTTEDKFYQTFDKTVDMIDPTGLISGAMDLLGMGPDDWATEVEPRMRKYVSDRIADGREKYLNNASLSDVQRLTYYDAYLSSYSEYKLDQAKGYDSSNSINGAKLISSLFMEEVQRLRIAVSQNFNVSVVTKDVSSLGLTDFNGDSFTKEVLRYGRTVTYGEYSLKRTKEPVQTVDVTGKPLTDVGTGVPTTDVNIPTDSPYFEDKPKENEGSFNWLYVIIPAVVVGVWKLGEFLIKKIKKK